MALNPYVGWGVTALLSYFLNRSSDDSDPAELTATGAELGTPVPVVMGRSLVKSPLTIYYGGFKARAYTETYASHATFNAWDLILAAVVIWATIAISGQDATTHIHKVTTTGGSGTATTTTPDPIPTKEKVGPKILQEFVEWLFISFINGRLLKTTIQKGFKYYLGYQMLVCTSGSGIRVRGIYLNPADCSNEAAWTGDVSRDNHPNGYTISIDDDELFGGVDENGGFVGDIRLYLGGAAQGADSWMREQMSADSVQEELRGLTPAYRPFVSLVVPVAYIGKQASIPETWIDVQYIPNRLGLGGIGDNDANPAEAVYEMVVNDEWGLGRDPALIDVDSLVAVGNTLAKEGLGVSLQIASRTEVKDLIDNICDHLDMVRYTDPATGKLTFKLIRDDYTIDDLPIIDKSIASAIDFTRTVWSDSAGEIVAKYSDSESLYDTSTVMDNDPAVIEMNDGDRNSQDMDFTYFTTSANAAWAANRELRQQGYPLASAKLTCNRKAYQFRQGDVFKLNWDPYGISGLVMRVTDVDLGDFVSGEITIEAMEDVFGVGKTTYSSGDSTSWKNPEYYPTGVQFFKYFEAPWELVQSKESYVYAGAVQPSSDTVKWNLWRYKDTSWVKTNSMTKWTPTGQLVGSLAEDGEVESVTGFEVINLGGLLDLASRRTESGVAYARNGGRLLMIDDEIMGWGTITQLSNGDFRISHILRATYDTVPAYHASGATVYFLDSGYYGNVTTGGPVCAAGETVSEQYNITTASATAEEAFDDTKITALATVRRSERPNPPGRIRLTTFQQEAVSRLTSARGDVVLTWAIRNKSASLGCVSQDDITDYYTGLDITAPTGIETMIRAYLGSTLIHEETISQTDDGLSVYPTTPTSFTYTWGQRCQDSTDFSQETILTITSKLNDLESYQHHTRTFMWKPPYIVDACTTEEDARNSITAHYANGSYTVVFDDVTLNKNIPVASMPLIIMGTVVEEQQDGAILSQAGQWIVPNGTAWAITGQGTYEVISLNEGYIALTYFNPDNAGDLAVYQYSNGAFTRIAVPNL